MKNTKTIEALSYEEAYAELEAVVAKLESSQCSLEESITLFERGQAVAKRCAQLLSAAELKVQQISGENIIGAEA